jgi:2'-5' RNA ligase
MDRVLVIFPELEDRSAIDDFRARFDPLAQLIPPHLTLVFPFEADLTTLAIRNHLRQSTMGMGPFPVRLQGVTGSGNEYLFLNVKRGNDQIVELHDRLYTGPLQRYLRRDLTFTPHLTIGRVRDAASWRAALAAAERFTDSWETVVDELAVYTIHPDGTREVELRVPLLE